VRRLLKPDVPDNVREAALARSLSVSYERAHSGYDEALASLDEALAALPARSGTVGAQVYAALSVTHYRRGDYREAAAWGKRALAAARRAGDAHAIAYAHNMLANALNAEGSLRAAVRHLREAVRLYDETGDVPGQAAANNNLGMNLQYLGELDEALACYRRARAADERVGDTVDMAIAHNNIGEILLIQGVLDDAERNFNLAVQGSGSDEELTALAGLAYVNLCRVSMARGDLASAGDHLREGVRLLRKAGARGLLTEARLQRAELLLASGDDLAAAMREAQRGYEEARASGDRRLESRGERLIGQIFAAGGDHNAASTRIAAAATLARKIGERYEEALALTAQARLYETTGRRPPTAIMRRADTLLEQMRAALPTMTATTEPAPPAPVLRTRQ
jgi:tetratricopeptide (TPR) repeat protein